MRINKIDEVIQIFNPVHLVALGFIDHRGASCGDHFDRTGGESSGHSKFVDHALYCSQLAVINPCLKMGFCGFGEGGIGFFRSNKGKFVGVVV